ncbi:tyrosine-type recombinase/integrase [Vibrio parahaemolyticus]|uniref:tyrosine-type recombinase/integrase n=1 Tax=Vibrio parahaemolyticus TaxID=670 RepID=UPI001A26068D|nr:tyrosine-type recombinase/integrase [Vibrio parahaemolyticus]EGQ7798840.1 tyrosine-type recombinase/integrase [Vibrio parahaemolyticus]EGQ8110541.1 tyrosine-type recombinase/integrase [Vibrio parahaemolyticus]EGQ8198416.1 tyrosine-type recombinase/integrase [Vibrio parahaemolyticus]EGU0149848.1 tyrosine-type recombinase/integrase [Vibrio parahaemolyticus]EKQ5912420.1 tyrosine-type recombinase/integrase [Vibrio parahaemolyticus]
MYLLKLPSSVYYHRSPVPTVLRERGFPSEIRLSLLTKDRSIALQRNIQISLIVKQHLIHANQDDTLTFEQVKSDLYEEVSLYRDKCTLTTSQVTYQNTPSLKLKQFEASKSLSGFLLKKKLANVTALTLHQLEQRISHCLNFVEENTKPYTDTTMEAYVDQLQAEGRSAKTNKEYFSAVKQFFAWCHSQKLLKVNPCAELNPKFKSKKHASEERDRWEANELDALFNSAEYQSKSDDFRYITELIANHGLRPNEACQLALGNVQQEGGIWFLDITDLGEKQHLKNEHSVRQIPLHPDTVQNGFLQFVQTRAESNSPNTPLFNYKPYGEDYDWSKHYRVEFGKLQTKIGMQAGARPTPYGFRHTFIDELQNAEVAEALVSGYVGHASQSITFGRYGKRLKLKKLLKVVRTFKLPTEMEV